MKRRQLIGMHRLLSRCVPVYVLVRVRVRVREREREREHAHVRIFSPIMRVYYLYLCVYTCSFLVNEACLLCMSLVPYE